jgi:hypothetical protein
MEVKTIVGYFSSKQQPWLKFKTNRASQIFEDIKLITLLETKKPGATLTVQSWIFPNVISPGQELIPTVIQIQDCRF